MFNFAKKKKKKGFTLIELLVVIAIIGILATIVIVNVNAARQKAKDTAVKGSVDAFRASAELWYDDNSNSYTGVCTSPDFDRVNATVQNNNGSVALNCNEGTGVAYAAFAKIQGGSGDAQYYCIDSTGNAGATSTDGGAVTECQL